VFSLSCGEGVCGVSREVAGAIGPKKRDGTHFDPACVQASSEMESLRLAPVKSMMGSFLVVAHVAKLSRIELVVKGLNGAAGSANCA
jgi:hypothetical protein